MEMVSVSRCCGTCSVIEQVPKWVRYLVVCIIVFIVLVVPVYYVTKLVLVGEEGTVEVRGGGSTLASAVYSAWMNEYSEQTDKFGSYSESSSVDGVEALFASSSPLVFAGTDAALDDDDLNSYPIQQLPSVATGVVVVYNIPESWLSLSKPLNLTVDIVCAVYNGSITSWNDKRLISLNPNLPRNGLPVNRTINPVHYTQANGATYIFTQSLSNHSPDWALGAGAGDEVAWPTTAGMRPFTINGNDDMPAYLSDNPWSMGYASMPVILSTNASAVGMANLVDNCNGTDCKHVIAPTAAKVANTARRANFTTPYLSASFPRNMSECRDCWPFTNFTYLVLRSDYNASDCNRKIRNLKSFLKWCYTDSTADQTGNSIGFYYEQDVLRTLVDPLVDGLQCNGHTVGSEDNTTEWAWVAVAAWFLFMCVVSLLAVMYALHKQRKKELSERTRLLDPRVQLSPLLLKANIGEEELSLEKPIGTGSFGEVYSGYWRGTKVAIKRMLVKNLKSVPDMPMRTAMENMAVMDDEAPATLEDFVREANLMSNLRHPNIIQFLGATLTDEYLYIVLELAERGSLFHVLKDKSIELSFSKKLKFAEDAARGMLYLHSCTPPIIHRDLKTANLLVGHNWDIKVTDFGLSRVLDSQNTMTHCGTVDFCAPEVLKRNRYTEKADVYSYGLSAWQIFTRKEPFYGLPIYEMMNKIITEDFRPSLEEISPPELAQLIQECWSPVPEDRPAFPEVLERLLDIRRRSGLSRTLELTHSPTLISEEDSEIEQDIALLSETERRDIGGAFGSGGDGGADGAEHEVDDGSV